MTKTLVSLCDYTGEWARPYAEAGWRVLLVDIKHPKKYSRRENVHRYGITVQEFRDLVLGRRIIARAHGILAAPPCTHFSSSGAQHWKAKDADGRTESHLEIVDACLDIIDALKPDFWALENPVGRLFRLRPLRLGRPKMYFQPCDYGDPYTKKTGLWGMFNTDLPKTPVEPVMYESGGKRGSIFWMKLGGASERTKTLRSQTPEGFARAFYQANH